MTDRTKRQLAGMFVVALAPWLSGLYRDASVSHATSFVAVPAQCSARFLIHLQDDFEPVGYVGLTFGLTKDFRKVKVEAFPAVGSPVSFERLTIARADDLASRYQAKAAANSLLAESDGGLLAEKGEEHDKDVQMLNAETLFLKAVTFAEPSFSISMTMGGEIASGEYVDASMSQRYAIAMGDLIVKSIQVRPGAI